MTNIMAMNVETQSYMQHRCVAKEELMICEGHRIEQIRQL
jgi:hypothetical protein